MSKALSIFGGGDVPKPPKPPALDDKKVQEAAAAEMKRKQFASGYKSTILTDMMNAGLKTTTGG